MRVCLVSQEVAPFLHGGGIATYVSQMARALAQAGHEPHILTSARPNLQSSIPESLRGVRFHEVNLSEVPLSLDGYHMPLMRHSMGVYHALKHLHAKYRFDYIEFPDYNAEGYFSLRAKRSLGMFDDAILGVRLHMPDYICRDYDLQAGITAEIGILGHMERAATREADIITSPSRAMLDVTMGYLAGTMPEEPRQPRFVIPNPLEIGRAEGGLGGGVAEPVRASGEQTILFYGRTQHVKGCHLLVRAAKRLMAQGVNIHVRFIGGDTNTGPFGDPLKPHLRKMVGGLFEDRFHFEDNRPRHELARAIRAASVCCFPSLMESFSMACVEAMSMGAVVVGSSSGGIGEIIQDGVNGLLFEAGNDRDLERVLHLALTDAPLRAAVAHEAPRRIAEYCNPASIATSLADALASVRTRTPAMARIACLPAVSDAGSPAALAESSDDHTAAANNGHSANGSPAHKAAGPLAAVPTTPVRAAGFAPRVCVVIPFYNCGRFLPQTLDSLRRQTYTNYDLIIVDDGSTDAHSLQLLDSLKSQGLNIIRKPNGGPASARNVGFAAATSEWVLALDSDDLIQPTYLERALGAVARDPDLAVVCSPIIMHTEDLSTPLGVWVPLGLDRDLLPFINVGATAQCLLSREKVLSVGGYNEDAAVKGIEDWDLWCRLAGAGYRASVMPEFLLTYRVRSDGVFQTAVVPNEGALKARIMKAYARIALNPDVAMRLQLGEATNLRHHAAYLDGQLRAAHQQVEATRAASIHINSSVRQILDENVRYRIADRVNNALKGLRLQRPIKALTTRVVRPPAAQNRN